MKIFQQNILQFIFHDKGLLPSKNVVDFFRSESRNKLIHLSLASQ